MLCGGLMICALYDRDQRFERLLVSKTDRPALIESRHRYYVRVSDVAPGAALYEHLDMDQLARIAVQIDGGFSVVARARGLAERVE